MTKTDHFLVKVLKGPWVFAFRPFSSMFSTENLEVAKCDLIRVYQMQIFSLSLFNKEID